MTARENSSMVHVCRWCMSNRYFTVLLLLLYFYSADMYGDFLYNVCYSYVHFVKILISVSIVSYNSIKNGLVYFSIVV